MGIRPFGKVTNIITGYDGRFKAERGMLINQITKNLECYFGDKPFISLEGISSMSPLAFYESGVVEVVIPKGIISLSKYAFYNSKNLTNIKLSEGLEFIGIGSFWGCRNLRGISIPKSVHEIKSAAFGRCVSLERIEFKGLSTNASESIFEYQDSALFPSAYHSHCMTMGSFIEDLDLNYTPDIESFKCITIVVPKSTKNKYTFNPIHHLQWSQREMDRRFRIIENDEDC